MKGRFAPSPTGELHLGTARTALAAWLEARHAEGGFVLRMEDLDRPREVPGSAERILEDLARLGLDWDEGPDRGGEAAPYRQSERAAFYREAIARLEREGRLFRCYCSRAEVARAASAPHGPGDEGPRYPGTCRALDRRSVAAAERQGRRPALRFRVEPSEVIFEDAVFGLVVGNPAETLGDFVVERADGTAAYQLAVVVDDAAMGITSVVRGADLLSSTARQILLYRALGLTEPCFAHVPLVLGPDGQRLAKRHGAISVRDMVASGRSIGALVGWLGATLGLCGPDEEVAASDLIPRFAFDRLPREPTSAPIASPRLVD